MNNIKKKSSAAIVGLLDAIKAHGITPIDQESNSESSNTLLETKSYPEPLITEISDAIHPKFTVKELDTNAIKPWKMANRLQQYIDEKSCEELIDSIRQVGQQIPVLVRPSVDDKIYELICGARRLYCCQKLGLKILVAIVNLSDKEALLAMDAENRPREDISPYERALDYKRWISTGIYKNYVDIYQSIGIKKSLFTQMISLADIDPQIIRAFQHPSNLKIRWGYQIARLCKSESQRDLLINISKKLLGQNIKPDQVYKHLIESVKKRQKLKAPITSKTYVHNKIKLQVLDQKDHISLRLDNLADTKKADVIIQEIIKILKLNEVTV